MLRYNKQVDTNVLPPQNLWDGIEGAPEVFAKGVTTLPDAHLNMLELSLESGTINQANPLILIPSDPLGTDELIVSYGLDITGQWISLGYTDEQGNVRIEQLPIETKSRLGQETVPDSSIKIFFQKIFKTTPNHAQRILTPHWLSQVDQNHYGGLSDLKSAILTPKPCGILPSISAIAIRN